ncbi:MAG: DinB family protein [Vicinamibacterales bacterium]
MTVAELGRLYDYAYWANGKLLGAVAELSDDEFTRDVAGSYGSVRNTLVHVLSAEWGWLDRCGGPPRGPKLEPNAFPTLAAIREPWDRVEAGMRRFLAGLTDADLERLIEFSFPQSGTRVLPLGTLLQHGAVHGIHHRGQVALLLRLLGHAPGNVDLLFFDLERAVRAG